MPRPKRIALGGYVYHVLNRANGRLRIFRKQGDFLAFEKILAEGVERFEMRICGYCIMSNHWHLVLWPREDDDLSAFMRWITQTHTQRYHSSHGTVGIGHLYQGRYKSFPVQDEAYYLTVLRYAEANPLRAGLVEKADDWPWSSYAVRRDRESLVELAEGPVSLPGNWPALVHQSVAEKDVSRIQNSIKRGAPLGLGRWVLETARRMVLESTLRPKGRPKKSTGPLSRGRGFTLVELLVVIAIIALLLSILMPSLHKARSSALRVACAHNLKQIGLGVNMYLGDNDSLYPCAEDPVDPNYWLWMGRGWRQWVEPYVGGSVGVKNPSVLLCPEDRTDPGSYESTSYAYSMAFYHSPGQIDTMSEPADTYDEGRVQRSIPQRVGSVANPSAKILIGEWLSNHALVEGDRGWWCWLGERSFLLADGQVRFLKATEIRPARDELPDANLTINGVKGRDLAR